ncbi:Nucleotidyltransferase [Agrocybe pediades]|nr:Nucleotidyltransferase [Agrocybe pediades]
MLARHFPLNHRIFSRSTGSTIGNLSRQASSNVFKSKHNQEIVDLLLTYKEEEERSDEPNYYRAQAFAKAVYAVLKVDRPIRTGLDLREVQGIGPGIVTKINAHLLASDADLRDKGYPESYKLLVDHRTVSKLDEIPGIGPVTAKKLAEAGCQSLEDLKSGRFAHLLKGKQGIKLKYAGHLERAIRRNEAEEVLHFCRESLGPEYDVNLVGEYRRGFVSLSEIRMTISHPDFVHIPLPHKPVQQPTASVAKKPRTTRKSNDGKTNLLHSDIVPLLLQRGLLADNLSVDTTSWKGVARLPGPVEVWGDRVDRISSMGKVDGDFRKISLHLVPQRSQGSSMIVLTGDDHFVQDICYRAQQRGMLFNEYGLWKWTVSSPISTPEMEPSSSSSLSAPSVPTTNTGYWSLINSTTESHIFRELEMPFVDPTKRNFSFISYRTKTTSKKKRSILP